MTRGALVVYAVRAYDGGPVLCVGDSGFCADALGVNEEAIKVKALKSFTIDSYAIREYSAERRGVIVKSSTLEGMARRLGRSVSSVHRALKTGAPTNGWKVTMREGEASYKLPNSRELARDAMKRRMKEAASENGKKRKRKSAARVEQ